MMQDPCESLPIIMNIVPGPATSAPTFQIEHFEITPTSILVVWEQPNGEAVTGYEISYTYQGSCTDTASNGTVDIDHSDTLQQNLTGLEEFSTYIIAITAVNSTVSSYPSSVNVNTTSAGELIVLTASKMADQHPSFCPQLPLLHLTVSLK